MSTAKDETKEDNDQECTEEEEEEEEEPKLKYERVSGSLKGVLENDAATCIKANSKVLLIKFLFTVYNRSYLQEWGLL